MLGGVTRHMLPHLPGIPHLHVNRPLGIIYRRESFAAHFGVLMLFCLLNLFLL